MNELFSQRIARLGTENAFKIGPKILKVERQGRKVIKLNLGEPDFPLPEYIKDEVKKQLDLNNTHYTDPQGVFSFRKAIAEEISKTRKINLTPERVVVFPGAKPPIGFTQQAYLNEGDEVIYPSPSFPIYESFIKYIGAKPVPLHLREENEFGLSAKDLEPLITKRTKMIFLNFPSNPTGCVAMRKQLEEIGEVIKRKCGENIRIYSDEVYDNIIFDGLSHESIASIEGMDKRTIIVSGLSKTFSWTGGRIGYAIFPTEEEALVFKNLAINYYSCVPPFLQEAGRVALTSPLRKEAVGKMVKEFEERRNMVVPRLNKMDGVRCVMPRGAFYVFPNIKGVLQNLNCFKLFEELPSDLRKTTSPSTLFQMFLLFKYGVATMDRKSFGEIGSENEHYLRLSIANSMEDLKEGLERMEVAIKDRDGFHKFVKEGENLA